MNFQELLTRMKTLDTPLGESDKGDMDHDGKDEKDSEEWKQNRDAAIKKSKDEKVDEDLVDECGPDIGSSSMGQQDNVSMNVNMSGSGSGGIRDLINILKNIEGEHGSNDLGSMIDKMDHPHDDEPEMGGDKKVVIGGNEPMDEYANEPSETMGELPTAGTDIHRPHGNYAATQPGDNPMAVRAIKEHLDTLYSKIKNR